MDLSIASCRRPEPEEDVQFAKQLAAVKEEHMTKRLRMLAIGAGLLVAMLVGSAALAEKPGGVLRMYHFDSPASLSLHEEVTFAALGPAMGLFNNLVMFDQHVPQASLNSIVPDLATEWSWDSSKTELRFRLHEGVKWHDGKPFTANDVKCTWDTLLGKTNEKFRLNPRKAWYQNLEEVTTKGDLEVTFHLKRPQPSFIALLASGWSAVYPCHVTPREIRTQPIGTGPFKLVEFKPNESIKVTKNPDYWKRDRPYLDGIEYTIIKNPSTRVLAFIAGKFDMTTPYNLTIPLMRDIQSQAPQAICELTPTNVARNLIVNRDKPPFDNPDIRRAMALSLDRKAFIDTINEGKADIGGAMLPPPEGIWGMPPEMLKTLPGYDPNIAKNRSEARKIMGEQGYGADNRLKITVSTRNIPQYRDPAIILIDQLKQIYIDGNLEEIDTVNWYPKLMRKDFTVGLNLAENGLDEPDQTFYENFGCGADRNYTGYCNPELEREFDRQSMEADPEKRKRLVWNIDKKLQEDGARPMIYHNRAGTCWYPQVKGLTIMVNSIYNGARYEDIWLDR
jgi:peptide/nickel transport system substrate-binding protein